MLTKKAILAQGCQWEEAVGLNQMLGEFNALEASVFKQDTPHPDARIAHNLFILTKALFMRLQELSASITLVFNDGHIIASLVLARSVFETALFAEDLERRIRTILERENYHPNSLEELDDLILHKMFSTRRSDFLEDMPEFQATNVQTLLKKANSEHGSIQHEYETLSDYTHANTLGHYFAYVKTDMQSGAVSFQRPLASENGLFHLIHLAFLGVAGAGKTLEIMIAQAGMLATLETEAP